MLVNGRIAFVFGASSGSVVALFARVTFAIVDTLIARSRP